MVRADSNRGLLNSMLQAVVATDLEGRITVWNQAAQELLGWTEKEVLGHHMTDFMPSEETQKETEAIQVVLQGGAPWKGRINVTAKGGREFTVELSASAIKDEKGQMAGLLGVFQDITELMQARADVLERTKELRALNRMTTEGATTAGLESLLQLAVDTLEPAFLHEDLWVRARVGETEVTSPGKPPGGPVLAASFDTALGAGSIEVQYHSTHPDQNQDPFLQEEQELLDSVADHLATFVSRDHATAELQQQAQLLKSVSQAVMATDLAGKITYWNKGAEKIYGWTQEEVIGRSITDVTPSEVSEKQAKEIFSQLQKGESWTGEFQVQRKDGSSFWAMVYDAPLVDEQGHLEGIIGVSFDITEQREIQGRLLHQGQLLGAVGQAVTGTDLDGKVTFWNEPAEALYGWTREEAMGRSVAELLGEAYIEEPSPETAGEPTSTSVDHWMTRKDGSRVLVNLATSPIVDDGGLRGFVAIGQDVTRPRAMQKRFQEVVTNAPYGVFRTRKDGSLVLANPEYARIAGYPSVKELMDDLDSVELFYVDLSDRAKIIETVERDGVINDFEFRIRRSDGETRWVSATVYRSGASDADLEGFIRDVTELKSTEARLEEAQAMAKMGSWELDLRTDTLWWSDQNYRVFGQTPGAFEATYDAFLDAIHPEDRAMVDEAYKRSLETKELYAIDHRLIMPDGSIKWVREQAKSDFEDDGKPIRSVGTTQDITERRKVEEVEARAVMLEEMAEFRATFLNMAAHELGTPLTPLALEIHLIRSEKIGPLNDKQRDAVGLLDRNLRRLQLLVQDMLDAARMQAGTLKFFAEPMDLRRVISDTAEVYAVPAQEKGCTIEYHGPEVLQVHADAQRYEQVVFNLVSNAIRYSPDGGRVQVRATAETDHVKVEIQDEGMGLDAAQIGRLFHPFTQVHDTAKVRGGTGLGLYITKGIVELHGGTIGVLSDGPGKGATFWFTVPTKAPQKEAETTKRAPDGDA